MTQTDNNLENVILDKAESIHKSFIGLTTEIISKSKNPNMTHQDAFNVVLLRKLAEMEIRIEKLERKSTPKMLK